MRNISNSEVTTWLSCRRMYYFAHYRNLAPKVTASPLARGTLGHEAFQVYAEARLNSSPHEQALLAGRDLFTAEMRKGEVSMEIVMQTKMLWDRYMAFHRGWPEWEILGTEQRHDLIITDDITTTIRYDLYVRKIANDQKIIVDFKFSYDFWRQFEHDLNGQMPKYITVMQNNGLRVDGGALEEIRTRPLGAAKTADHRNLWRRTQYFPSIAKKRNMMRQHLGASLEIMDYWNADDTQRQVLTIPVLNKHGACKFCNFKDLCNSQNDGGDIETAISIDYVDNTYGYNATEEIGELV